MIGNWGGIVSIGRSVLDGETLTVSNYHLNSSWEPTKEVAIEKAKKYYSNEFWVALIWSYEARKLQRHRYGVVPDGFVGYVIDGVYHEFKKPLSLTQVLKMLREERGVLIARRARFVVVDCNNNESVETIDKITKVLIKRGFEQLDIPVSHERSCEMDLPKKNKLAIAKAEIARHNEKKYFAIVKRHPLFPRKFARNWMDKLLIINCDCYLLKKDWIKLIRG